MAHGGLAEPPLLEPEIGTLCLAKYSKDGAYYRAYVMQIHSASSMYIIYYIVTLVQ
jgi:hypothetical protein